MKAEFLGPIPVTHVLQITCSTSDLRLLAKLMAANCRVPERLVQDNDLSFVESEHLGGLMGELHKVIQQRLHSSYLIG